MSDVNTKSNMVAHDARTAVAKWVIGGAAGGIFALAIAMIIVAKTGETELAAEKAFMMLVPLLGTWVGTFWLITSR